MSEDTSKTSLKEIKEQQSGFFKTVFILLSDVNRRNRIRDKNKKLNKMIQYAVFMHEKDGIANCRLQWFGNNRLTIRGGKKQLVTPKAENIK